jgi:hypothetical protein
MADWPDIDQVIELAKRGHAESELKDLPFDESGAKHFFALSLSDPHRCGLVVEHEGRVVGCLFGVVEHYPYCNASYATDVMLYAAHAGCGALLVNRFKEWGFKDLKVDRVLLADTYGNRDPHKAAGWYELMGFRHLGGTYVMERPA